MSELMPSLREIFDLFEINNDQEQGNATFCAQALETKVRVGKGDWLIKLL